MATLHNASTRTYMQQNHKSAASSSVSPGRWTSQWPHDGRTGVDTGRQQTAATGEVRKTCQQQPAWGRDDHVDGVEGGNNGTGARAHDGCMSAAAPAACTGKSATCPPRPRGRWREDIELTSGAPDTFG